MAEQKKLSAKERSEQEFMEAWNSGQFWEKSWQGGAPYACNWNTGKPYNGINTVTLMKSEYLTFNQVKELGKNAPESQRPKIRKGEHGSSLYFFTQTLDKADQKEYNRLKKIDPKKAEEFKKQADTFPMLKRYVVFRLDQIENLASKFDYEKIAHQQKEIYEVIDQKISQVLEKNGTQLHQGQGYGQPFFDQNTNAIVIGQPDQFQSMHAYYSTLIHELAHSDLDRQKVHFSYEVEECYAEISAGIACRRFGLIDDAKEIDNNYAYIEGWSKKVPVTEKNVKDLMKATNLAGRFADKLADGFDLLKFQEHGLQKSAPQVDLNLVKESGKEVSLEL